MLRNWKTSLAMALMAAMGSATAWANDTYFVADEAAAAAAAAPGDMPQIQAEKGSDVYEEASEEESTDPVRLYQRDTAWKFYGFAAAGVTLNGRPSADRYNGVQTFNDRREGQLNQLYVWGEKAIDTNDCSWQVGGRVDLMYGSDYIFNRVIGWELDPDGTEGWNAGRAQYGFVNPQAYVEIGNAENSFKVGKWYTPLGYEVVPNIGNFFYSHAYTHQYGEPFFHSGVLYTRTVNEKLKILAAVTNGWDAWDRDENPATAGGGGDYMGGILGFTWTNGEGTSVALIGTSSKDSLTNGLVGPFTQRNMYSLVVTQQINECWTYLFQHDYGHQDNANTFDGGATGAEWYGINQILFRKINDCWTAGGRFEWFRDDDGARVSAIRPGNLNGTQFAGNFFQMTLGANYKPNNNVIVRPEIRYDWFDGVAGNALPYNAGTDTYQFTAAMDVIVQF